MSDPASSLHASLQRLLPTLGAATTITEVLDGLQLDRRIADDARPYLMLNMVSTADGRATIGGRSGPIGNRADRELFHGLRSVVDGVIVGAGTARVERYGRILREQSAREARRERGLTEEPLACIVSGRLALPRDLPLLREPAARVVVVTSSQASLPDVAANLQYIRAQHEGVLDLPAALAELRERYSVRTLLCEGGPHLNAQLLAAGLVDELFLSLAPKLAGGDLQGEALRILAGPDPERPVEMELLAVLESESHLFLRYGLRRDTPSS